ncbi:hypothetical protein BDZ45DRAFT_727889 [Acephala macrosclerotiorum]|nr:hypothetical protein BDZ45DRAFT_727889 [Acephala macrosclerotiorum]
MYLSPQYNADEEYEDFPPWLNQARSFVDLRAREAQEFNHILDCHLPSSVTRWGCEEESGWTFEFDDLTLEVVHSVLDPRAPDAGWNLAEVAAHNVRDFITSNSKGVDLNTIETSADDLLRTSIKKICEGFRETYRILHVEPVTRADLANRFQKRQKAIYDDVVKLPKGELRKYVNPMKIRRGSALDTQEGLAEEICKPRVTFHGTQRHKVSSIVRYGFVKPGDKAGRTKIEVECGASFGVGIYTSPDFEYALWYSNPSFNFGSRVQPEAIPGIRLIVCATVMGLALPVSREDTRRTTEIADEAAHSHVSPDNLEYIVFDAAQIIPCYVIHLDFGAEFAKKELESFPEDPWKWVRRSQNARAKIEKPTYVSPADVEAAKAARKAAASKYFPYGYGPATGTSFVIQEIGETSDDEENYGDYQGMRIEVEDEVSKWEENISSGTSWFDEYQTSRTTFGNI